jgi:hypothetical protein
MFAVCGSAVGRRSQSGRLTSECKPDRADRWEIDTVVMVGGSQVQQRERHLHDLDPARLGQVNGVISYRYPWPSRLKKTNFNAGER